MKLELKHLAPYLPYGLKIGFEGKSNYIVNGYNGSYLLVNIIDSPTPVTLMWSMVGENYKPILRPLSDLTKEIEHNGETFVPMDWLFGADVNEEEAFAIYGTIPNYWQACLKVDVPDDWEYCKVQDILKWHFDVFGLIENGLAIDMNTIKETA